MELLGQGGAGLPPQALRRTTHRCRAGAAPVVTAAVRAGATVTAPPGEPVRIRHAEASLDPWALLGPIAAGSAEPASWTEHPVVRGLGVVPLRVAARVS